MAPDDRTARTQGAPRWMRILLVASLAVNLLILGTIVGAAVTGDGPWHGHGPHGGGPMARALSDEDRGILRQRLRAGAADGAAPRLAHREAMQTLLRLLRATPFDAGAVDAQMREVRDLFARRMERGQTLLAVRLAEMTDAERAAYADRLEAAMRRRPER